MALTGTDIYKKLLPKPIAAIAVFRPVLLLPQP